MGKKLTQDDFIRKVKENNKNGIDLSLFIYNGNNVKGKCKCNVCGNVWEVVPMSLFKGHGCPKCAVEYKARKMSKTLEEFKKEAHIMHGDKYDYSNVIYINDKTYVDIKCNECGRIFKQKPFLHLKGHGCKYCNGGVSYDKEYFLEKVRLKNKNNLIFDDFKYVNSTTKGKCKCGECGYEWYVLPSVLLGGHGCPRCSANKRGAERRKPFKEFVREYNEKYPNNDFKFIEETYSTAQNNMTIICPIHGKFFKRPNSLLNGEGCPICNESSLERQIRGLLEEKKEEFKQHKNDFEWLGKQSLDFYLPRRNIAIECQGSQHYKETNYYGGKEKLDKQIVMDERKFNLCKENNVKLLYYTNYKGEIPEMYRKYTFFDKDELLNEIKKGTNL